MLSLSEKIFRNTDVRKGWTFEWEGVRWELQDQLSHNKWRVRALDGSRPDWITGFDQLMNASQLN